jgi:hypothetical protein
MKNLIWQIRATPGILEAAIWLVALGLLAIWQPGCDAHFSLCPLNAVGFTHCPGCGLGRSVSQLLHGNIAASLDMHWLGIPATAILSWRIISVFRRFINQKQKTS